MINNARVPLLELLNVLNPVLKKEELKNLCVILSKLSLHLILLDLSGVFTLCPLLRIPDLLLISSNLLKPFLLIKS